MAKRSRLESWIDVPAVMETKHGVISGTIKYGVRLPIRSGTISLYECELGSREEIEGEKPRYWFINDAQAIKVELIAQAVGADFIKGIGRDSGFFFYTMRKQINLEVLYLINQKD